MRPPSVDALAKSLSENSPLPQPLLVDVAREAIDEAAKTADDCPEAAIALVKSRDQPFLNLALT